mgnify:CR=1 FL=1
MTQKIYIKPVPRTSVLGITTKSSDYIEGFDKNGQKTMVPATRAAIKRNGAKVTTMALPVSWETNKFKVFDTTTKAENPYYNTEEPIPSNWLASESMLRKSPHITWQMYYELKHNALPNTYTQDRHFFDRQQDRKHRSDITGSNYHYLEALGKSFYDGITILNLEIPEDEIWYLAFKESAKSVDSKFATNIEDAQTKPNALFYIVDEQLEDAQVLNEFALEDEAMAKFNELKTKFTPISRYQFAVLLDLTTTHAISDEKITTSIRGYLTKGQKRDTQAQRHESEKIYKTFLRFYDEFVDANKRADFNALYLIKEGVNREVLRKRENEYWWIPKGENNQAENLGRETSLLKKLKDRKNSDIVAELKDQIISKGVTFE